MHPLPLVFCHRDAQLLHGAHGIDRRDSRPFVIGSAAAVHPALFLHHLRLESLCHGPAFLSGHHVQVRQNIQLVRSVVQIRSQYIVVVIRRLQTISRDHFLRGFQRLIGSLAKGHAALRGIRRCRDSLSFGTVDPAEGLDILQHFRAVCLDPGFDLLPVFHLL